MTYCAFKHNQQVFGQHSVSFRFNQSPVCVDSKEDTGDTDWIVC